MKNTKKSSKIEPTVTDVMGVVQGLAVSFQGLAVSVQDLTEAVQEGFAKNETQHNEIKEDLNDIGYRVTALEKRTGSIEITLEDMKETLNSVARTVNKDSVKIVNHERRIGHLEKVCA